MRNRLARSSTAEPPCQRFFVKAQQIADVLVHNVIIASARGSNPQARFFGYPAEEQEIQWRENFLQRRERFRVCGDNNGGRSLTEKICVYYIGADFHAQPLIRIKASLGQRHP